MPDPIEKTEELVAEAERGRSERTPWLVWGGMHMIVGALVAAVMAIAIAAYVLA
ncbi:MAG: hypothetical protein M3R12_09765 [Actinomycetota bacterium]|nr:hypothetical protein [Actinomycetota bacterium]